MTNGISSSTMRAGFCSATATGPSRSALPIRSPRPTAPRSPTPTACPGSASSLSCCAACCPPPSSGLACTRCSALRCRGRPGRCCARAARAAARRWLWGRFCPARCSPACPLCGSARSAMWRWPRNGCFCLRYMRFWNSAPRCAAAAGPGPGPGGSPSSALRRWASTRIFCRRSWSARCWPLSSAAASPMPGAARRLISWPPWPPPCWAACCAGPSARAAGFRAVATANFP